MDSALVIGFIAAVTPLFTELVKKLVPENKLGTFKRFLPLIPPLTGMLMSYAGQKLGLVISDGVTAAVIGLLSGALGSSGYAIVKAQGKANRN